MIYPRQFIKLANDPLRTDLPGTIPGFVVGRFAVHLEPSIKHKRVYTITHIESGYSMHPFNSLKFSGKLALRRALQAMAEMEAVLPIGFFILNPDGTWEGTMEAGRVVFEILLRLGDYKTIEYMLHVDLMVHAAQAIAIREALSR